MNCINCDHSCHCSHGGQCAICACSNCEHPTVDEENLHEGFNETTND